jgi:hypothetical protein
MPPPTKAEIKRLLKEKDYRGIVELSREKRNLFSRLVAMTYDKGDVIAWRAMEAIGAITARMSPDEGRAVIQKVLWMLREESGNNAWSGPEILGEILRANPGPYRDVVPVLVSFHGEEFFRPGVLWAMYRIARRWPDLIEPFSDIAVEYLDSPDPSVRGYAALVLGRLGKPFPEKAIADDNNTVLCYDEGTLTQKPVRELLRMAAAHKSLRPAEHN